MSSQQRGRINKMLLDQLESLHHCGVLQLPKSRSAQLAPAAIRSGPINKTAVTTKSSGQTETSSAMTTLHNVQPAVLACRLSHSEQQEGLATLQESIIACTKCPVLVQNRTQTVFGVGDPQSRVVFLGEAPGADEDRLGKPFVGRAGQLLTRMIEACTMRREDVYILNILKCRPPNNRTPLPDEIENCRPYFERQLELLRPEFICCLGAVAARGLLQTNEAVGKLRGKIHNYKWAKVVVTYHPAYLLRSPDQKKAAWEDLKLLMREMRLDAPQKLA